MKRVVSKADKMKRLTSLLNRRRNIIDNKAGLQEAEDMKKYRVDELHEVPAKETAIQHNEINGKLPFDEGQYHCEEYNDLMKNITPLRAKFSEITDIKERKSLATEEISHWHNYMLVREKALPEHFQMNPTTISLLEEIFERESERRNQTLRSDRVVDYHYTFSKQKKFDVPIHRRNMLQMIHPYHGYMNSIDNKFFTFDEMLKMYRQQLVSSYERSLGQTFLAGKYLLSELGANLFLDELSCLSFWDIIDEDRKGFVNYSGFIRVLKMFRFNLQPFTLPAIKKEFDW